MQLPIPVWLNSEEPHTFNLVTTSPDFPNSAGPWLPHSGQPNFSCSHHTCPLSSHPWDCPIPYIPGKCFLLLPCPAQRSPPQRRCPQFPDPKDTQILTYLYSQGFGAFFRHKTYFGKTYLSCSLLLFPSLCPLLMTPDQDYILCYNVSCRLAHCRQWVNACCVNRSQSISDLEHRFHMSAVSAKKKAPGLPWRQGREIFDMASLNHLVTPGSGWILLGQGRGWLTEKQKSQLERDPCRFGNGQDHTVTAVQWVLGLWGQRCGRGSQQEKAPQSMCFAPQRAHIHLPLATSHLPGSLPSLGAFPFSPFLTAPFINDHKQSLIWQ